MRRLLRFWFRAEEAVDRRRYIEHGVGLALIKYGVDALLILGVTGVIWSPVDYVATGVSIDRSAIGAAPQWLKIVLALWTAPFFWIGLSMSARRARAAGLSPWLGQLFFVPFVNYAFIALMCLLPDRRRDGASAAATEITDVTLATTLRAMGLGAAAGLGVILLGVQAMNSYGAFLFFGAPFVIGAVTAYYYNRAHAASAGSTTALVMITTLVVGLATIMFAIEGLGCLVMAYPFSLVIAQFGSTFGRWIALNDVDTPAYSVLGVLLLPASGPLWAPRGDPGVYEVKSAVEIDAPPMTVWKNVVSFPKLAPPTDLLSRTGISYPIGARIEGEGVGAIRYCDFSTGSFVEPITHWEPGIRLGFDITDNPPPMREWSPYAIQPPHLDGYFAAKRGEFRLIELPGGRTRLEGSTWYELRMGPELYWSFYADAIVERIHTRVLEHIREISKR